MYGHAERARIAAQRAIDETVDLLLSLPTLDDDQLDFVEEFAPERLPARPGRAGLDRLARTGDRTDARVPLEPVH